LFGNLSLCLQVELAEVPIDGHADGTEYDDDPRFTIHEFRRGGSLVVERKKSRVAMGRVTGRDGIVSLATPRMAAADTAESKPGAAQEAVTFDRLQEVLGAGWMKAATRAGAANEVDGRRQKPLIKANAKPDQRFHGGGGAGRRRPGGLESGRRMPERRAT
jgi:hypothetical protein